MAVNFPTSLDNWTNPTGADTLATTPHSTHHADHYDAIEALEARVGVTNSAVSTSLTKRIAVLEAAAKNFWGGSPALVGGAGNFAWKGNAFTPTSTLTVYGITACLNALAGDGAVVQGAITTVSGGLVATISLTQTYTQTTNEASAGGEIYLPFASPVTMTGAVAYQIMIGSNAGAGVTTTTSFPIGATNGYMWANRYQAPAGTLPVSSYYRMSTLAPVVGTALATTAGPSTGDVLPIGLVWA